MKYTIQRQFSFGNQEFEVTRNSKTVSVIKVKPSKQYKDQFTLKLSNLMEIGGNSCIVESDENYPKNYLIYSVDDQLNKIKLFGQLQYELCGSNNYLYTIIIGQKSYKVRSTDLKYRRLVITDTIESNTDEVIRLNYPEILYQVIDSFARSNQTYHVNIHDKEWPLGYLAITILLHLHESQRNDI